MKLTPEVFWIAVGQALNLAGTFIGLKILSTNLGPTLYGELGLALAIGSIANSILFGPISNSLSRYVNDYLIKKKIVPFFSFTTRLLLFSALIYLFVSLSAAYIVDFYSESSHHRIIVVAILYGAISGIQSNQFAILSALKVRKEIIIGQGVLIWSRFFLASIFIFLFERTAIPALIGYLLSDFLSILYQGYLIHQFKTTAPKTEKNEIPNQRILFKQTALYALPFIGLSLFSIISTSVDRWIVNWLLDLKSVGIYYALSQLANTPSFIIGAILNQYLTPYIFKETSYFDTGKNRIRGAEKKVIKAALIILSGTLLSSAVALPISNTIIHILTSKEYLNHPFDLSLLIFNAGLFQTGLMLCLYGQIYQNNFPYILSFFVKAVIFLALCFILAPLYQLTGIISSAIISSVAFLIMTLLMNNYITNKRSQEISS